MEVLKWLLIISFGIVFCVLSVVLINLIFVGKITEVKIWFSSTVQILDNNIQVEEKENVTQQVINVDRKHKSALPLSEKLDLTSQGKLIKRDIFSNEDQHTAVISLRLGNTERELIFKKNSIYERQDNQIGKLLHELDLSKMKIQSANYVNEQIVLLSGMATAPKAFGTYLWQIDLNSFEVILLTTDLYFSSIPPKILTAKGFDGVIAIYYQDSFIFGFGGDCTQPRISTIRLYSSKYPQGHDIAKFSYKAGTIIDVSVENGVLILTGDPSRPQNGSDNHHRPARFWKISGF
ncbi:MAG: hypothetical protein ACJAT7_001243 [Psychromonas sp.]|jgi:hypothetical protein|uniref:hypothetical protein n=1 Tax=Psychromonas sp. TaxID=1884585 RepID=UPI0039E64317